jgi:hypothetical protein
MPPSARKNGLGLATGKFAAPPHGVSQILSEARASLEFRLVARTRRLLPKMAQVYTMTVVLCQPRLGTLQSPVKVRHRFRQSLPVSQIKNHTIPKSVDLVFDSP